MVSVNEALSYLGIDYADKITEANVQRCIVAADAWLKGAVGREYPKDDPRAKELLLAVCADLYDHRGLHSTVSGQIRRMVTDFSLQLQLEMRND